MCAMALGITTYGQSIVNGAFESWTSTPYDEPNGWFGSNNESLRSGGVITSSKVTGQSGQAIMLETKVVGGDTVFGFFASTQGDPTTGQGGFPYSQKPDSIKGYYKYDIKSGDSALLLVVFKKLGNVIGLNLIKITGTQSSFTAFSYPVTSLLAPDTVIIAAASSNAIDEVGVQPGSTITFDELSFVGTGTLPAIPNGNFDSWTAKSLDLLDNWDMGWEGGSRTTDKYKGDYAVLLETLDGGDEGVFSGNLTYGDPNDFSQGGMPFTTATDTLVFYYKYIPSGTDTANAWVSLKKNGVNVGGNFINLFAASTYTRVEVPFNASQTPDSISINFQSSNWPYEPANAGSKLYIDEVQLKSNPINTGIRNIIAGREVLVFPNPSQGVTNFSFTATGAYTCTFTVTDVLGRVVSVKELNITEGQNTVTENLSQLAEGVYYYSIIAEGTAVATGNFVKK